MNFLKWKDPKEYKHLDNFNCEDIDLIDPKKMVDNKKIINATIEVRLNSKRLQQITRISWQNYA